MIYIIRNIRASRVNLAMNDYVSGLPSPLSFIGLADSLARTLKLKPWSASVLPILHHVTISKGRTKAEAIPEGKVLRPAENMEDLVGTVEVSLILDLPGCESELDVAAAMRGKRIAGGEIAGDDINVIAVTAEGRSLRKIKRGFAMIAPEKDAYQQVSSGNLSKINEIIDLIFPAERKAGDGWIIGVAAGYRLLEDPSIKTNRSCRRDVTINHVFAEPCLGMAELVSVRNSRLTSSNEEKLKSFMWKWSIKNDFLLGHQNYQPGL
jgi:hypothetical protein